MSLIPSLWLPSVGWGWGGVRFEDQLWLSTIASTFCPPWLALRT